MNRFPSFALMVLLSMWIGVGAVASPPVDIHAGIAVDDPNPPLPRYATAEEQLIPPVGPTREDFLTRSPPTGSIHCPAEYEPQEGLFIAWEGYTDVLTNLTVGITTGDPDAIVYVVVDSSSEQSSAYSMLNSAGADMTQVEFIIRTTDTVWMRDYGPRFVYEDGNRAIIDHNYNRPRPYDNAFNDYLSTLWSEPEYNIPLTHGGGNFHLFTNGDAFMTDLILDENAGLSEQEVIDLYAEYQNVDLTIYPAFPQSFDWTGHIDMWMLPVGDDKIIIGEYPTSGTWDPHPHDVTEDAVVDLESRGYTVYRTPGWYSGGTHYTYTNAVVLNDQVFIPQFGGSYTSEDAVALGVFQEAFRSHDVSQVYCGSIIQAAGALHCIVMHVPAFPIAADCNCDDELDMNDVAAFILALIDPVAYDVQYFLCGGGDMDKSGAVDGKDIQPFVNALLPPP